MSYDNKYYYTINIFLNLSEGVSWQSVPNDTTAKPWVSISGITLTGWNFSVSKSSNYLALSYSSSGQSSQISIPSGVTITIDSNKLTEIKGYTNVTNNLTTGTASASFSTWN